MYLHLIGFGQVFTQVRGQSRRENKISVKVVKFVIKLSARTKKRRLFSMQLKALIGADEFTKIQKSLFCFFFCF